MALQKNTAGKWIVFAFDRTDNTALTGDAANITANVRIDGGAANAVDDTNPTELEDGYYVFDITAAEANGDLILLTPVSVTADIQVIGVPGALYTSAPYYNALGIESDGDLTKVNLCATTTTNTDLVSAAAVNTAVEGGQVGTDAAATQALAVGVTGFAAIDTVVDAILDDTGTNGVALLAATQTSINTIEIDTTTDIPATISTMQGNITAALVDAGINYYVETTGNDGNSGKTAALAFLTVPAAIAVAVAGDTIRVGAGTFASAAFTLANGVTLQGEGIEATILSNSSDFTTGLVILGNDNTVRDVKIHNETSGPMVASVGVRLNGDHVVLDNVWAHGTFDGLGVAGLNRNLKFNNCIFEGSYDGCNLTACVDVVATDCHFKTNGDWDVSDVHFRAMTASGFSTDAFNRALADRITTPEMTFIRCTFDATRPGTSAGAFSTSAVEIAGNIRFDNCRFYAEGTSGSYTGDVIGVTESNDGAGALDENTPLYATFIGGVVHTVNAGSGAVYDLSQRRTNSSFKVISLAYDTAKTNGTITDVPATAQADLDIITGASGVNLLTATQTSIDAIEQDTTTDIPALIGTAADTDIATDIANLDAVVDTVKAETVLILQDTAAMDTIIASFTFTTAGIVDCNMERINNTALVGDGGSTPWGP